MIYFIESSFPAFLSNYINNGIFIYTKGAFKYAPSKKYSFSINSFFLFKVLKVVFSILRFKCTFQGGFGIAHTFSKSKAVISDGILTEWLYKNNYIKVNDFVSLNLIKPSIKVNKGESIIFGNNFYESGSFSYLKYMKYLQFLSINYPNAFYFPHPKEISGLPESIFKNRLINVNLNIETYCVRYGIPENIIGFIGSTSIASIAKLAQNTIVIEAVKVNDQDYDGPIGNITDPQLLKKRNIRITTTILENTVVEIISGLPHVLIKETLINLK